MKTFAASKLKYLKRSLSSAGFTLMEIMIGLAIGSITMSAMMTGLSLMMTQKKMADQPIESSMLLDRVSLATSKPSLCATNLVNTVVNPAAPVPVTVDGMQESSEMGKGMRVKTMKISVNPVGSSNLTDPPGGKRYPAYIQVQTTQDINGVPHDSKTQSVPLHVNVDSTGKIVSCNSDSTDQTVCIESGGTWDSAGPIGLKCTPTNHCLYGGSYSTLPVSQGGFGNMANGGLNSCPNGFKVQQSGMISIASKQGKYGVKNTDFPVYNCMRCGSGAGAVAASPVVNSGAYDLVNADADAAAALQQSQAAALNALGSSLGISGAFNAFP